MQDHDHGTEIEAAGSVGSVALDPPSGEDLSGPLTLNELLVKLGKIPSRAARRQLIRRIRARERRTGKELLLQNLPGEGGSTFYTTMALIRQHLKELQWRDRTIENALRTRLAKLEESCRLNTQRNSALASLIRRHMGDSRRHR